MTSADVTAQIQGQIRSHLEPLMARLRGPAIAALAGRLIAAGGGEGLASLVLATPRAVATLQGEHAAVQQRLVTLEAEVHAEATPAGQQQALARAIRREVHDPARRRGDLRALHRDLDLAALRERFAGELDALETQVELALGFLGSAAPAALASEPAAGPPLRRADLPRFLLAQLTWRPRFTLRLCAAKALQRVCDALGPADPDGEIAGAMLARLFDLDEHPWVAAEALAVLAAVAPAEGLRVSAEIVRAPSAVFEDMSSRTDMRAAPAPADPSASMSGPAFSGGGPRTDVPWTSGSLWSGGAGDPGDASLSGMKVPSGPMGPIGPIGRGGLLRKRPTDPTMDFPAGASCDDMRTDAVLADDSLRIDLEHSQRITVDDPSLRIDLDPSVRLRLDTLADQAPDAADQLEEYGPPPPRERAFTGRRAFLLRRLVVDALPTRFGERHAVAVFDLIAAAVAAREPSEHVRVGLARAAALACADERFVVRGEALLHSLADPLGERSPAVRAATLRAVPPALAVSLLVRSLSEETSPVVLRVACTEAARHGGAELVAALTRLAARDDRPAPVHEAAAGALEAIDRAADPTRAAWTAHLADRIARIPPGGSARVPLHAAELPPPGDARWLGRILADLTRDSWGVDVDVGRTHLTIRRGDRWRARLWRVLHELRSPSPNKRQAHSHARGRVLRGELRAHSGRLHEVTGTGVPGERIHSDREGGWGRHLPLADDLLGLPVLRARPVEVVSSFGVCTISSRRGLLGRIAARLRLQASYAWLAGLRQESLSAAETNQRGNYVATLRETLGVELRFTAHASTSLSPGTGHAHERVATPALRAGTEPDATPHARPLPAQLRALFPDDGEALALPPIEPPRHAAAIFVAPDLVDWIWLHAPYFVSISANSQQALAYFLAGLAALGLIAAYWKNRGMARDRAAVPLVIGGWGTRGKSGTERLKAGLLHGLGYRVFSKTTGCEAMFIHAPPLGPAREIYSFRPYGKATIWEQRTLLGLAARMHTEVFLWECMALSPAYVQILQHGWMRDDLSTITNAYPDHEDIQGPAGIDVAEVISGFVPGKSTLVTSEINFLPVLQAAADRRGTRVAALGDLDGDLLPADLLALFPYEEHPRNIALVARLAVELGLDPTLAIVTMASHVVPDLGVLKRFGPARVRGRLLEFINGCSANERTGFVSNWRRTGCDALDLASEPDQYVITVVNNRDDRVSRSQVFARVLVEDTACDRHVIIGTNTQGLLGYVRESLDEFLARQRVVRDGDPAYVGTLSHGTGTTPPANDGSLSPGTAPDARSITGAYLGRVDDTARAPGTHPALARLDALLTRLRVVPARAAALAQQLEIFARGAARDLPRAAVDEAARRCAPYLAADAAAPVELEAVLAQVRGELAAWAQQTVEAAPAVDDADPPEVDAPASPALVAGHFVRQVARTAIACRLHARLAAALTAGPAAIEGFHDELRAAYRGMFMELIDIVDDPLSTGDQTILRCALAVPPGVRVAVMGTQNIKGTGLDFVYRWIALDAAEHELAALRSGDPAIRRAALERLEHPDDPGLIDAGLVAAALARRIPEDGEAELQTRVQARAAARHAARVTALGQQRARQGRAEAFYNWLEGWIDFLDGARRHARAKQVMQDLIDQRISHARAAQVMRDLDARAKGGWLVKAMRSKR